ncbi:MAG: DUF362 domain-containing protein [Phycisphaerales bacterium]|nr:DUF362 domain-containing protein [Phycisphaerales bacterium]
MSTSRNIANITQPGAAVETVRSAEPRAPISSSPCHPDRRGFLISTATLLAGAARASIEDEKHGKSHEPAQATPHAPTHAEPHAPSRDEPPTLDPRTPRPRVVRWASRRLNTPSGIREDVVTEGIHESLTALTGTGSTDAAWAALLKPDDVVGIKFNRSGQAVLGTTPAMARALVGSLRSAGWSPSHLVLIEAPEGIAEELGTLRARAGFEAEETDFGSGKDQFSAVLKQVTAIINVPFLKTHNIAGMTCGMKNLAYGLVRRPGRLHANHCCPFITDIYQSLAARVRIALTLVDAARITFADGPLVKPEYVDDAGVFILGMDPVAVDTLGLSSLSEVRKSRGLPELDAGAGDVPYLHEAHRKGLGVAVPLGIDVRELGEAAPE